MQKLVMDWVGQSPQAWRQDLLSVIQTETVMTCFFIKKINLDT
jgi:hypothetical protein